jgi:hypothetical protein
VNASTRRRMLVLALAALAWVAAAKVAAAPDLPPGATWGSRADRQARPSG